MPRTATVIDMFLSSPSDVVHERGIVRAAVREWNAIHGPSAGVMTDSATPVGVPNRLHIMPRKTSYPDPTCSLITA